MGVMAKLFLNFGIGSGEFDTPIEQRLSNSDFARQNLVLDIVVNRVPENVFADPGQTLLKHRSCFRF